MTAITTRPSDLAPRDKPSGRVAHLLRRLSVLATAAAERLASPHREVPPEFFRFPPF